MNWRVDDDFNVYAVEGKVYQRESMALGDALAGARKRLAETEKESCSLRRRIERMEKRYREVMGRD